MLNKLLKTSYTASIAITVALSSLQSAHAAPGPLATAPLFLSSIVEPNVFFTLDDSGSMDFQLLAENGAAGFFSGGGLPIIDGRWTAYLHPTWNELYTRFGYRALPPTNGTDARWEDFWVYRNHNVNKLYYNPDIKYTAWAGSDTSGNPLYTDADIAAVKQYANSTTSATTNITQIFDYTDRFGTTYPNSLYLPTYFTWTDTNGNGQVDTTDAHTMVEIDPAGTEFVTIDGESVNVLQNFANWFQYYRSRINTTKAAIGAVMSNTDSSRMGLGYFNQTAIFNLETMSDIDNKFDLLTTFYNSDPQTAGTPARRALNTTGAMFANPSSGAILSAADGGECQQNFNILMSDGFWNGANPGVGNRDENDDSIYDGDSSQSNDGGNYADSFGNTLADVAMAYYENDLRTDLDNNVPVQAGVNEASHQHLVNYSIAFGINGVRDVNLDPADPADGIDDEDFWPEPQANQSSTVDDMWHAAYNSRGQYLTADDPETLSASLDTAVSDIAERTATAAAVSINSAKLTTESVVYVAQFNTNRWQGNLFAFNIDPDTGALATVEDWSAADELNGRNFASSPRTVITHDGSDGVKFDWDSLSVNQQNDLMTNPAGTLETDVEGKKRLDYLRGSRANEGTGEFYRERASLLSDLVNSGPVFVGKPSLNWPDRAPFPTADGSRYTDFKNGSAATRDGVVYIGSNGGMLHGFAEKGSDGTSSTGGKEVLAYIPNNLFSDSAGEGMHYLTDPNYVHKYYNDLTPTVSDIYANLGGGTKWQTVLVSGQRGGGRGIFALNVNDPGNFSEDNAADIALWEFTNADDPDLGFTYSRPQIGMMNNGRWVAIFGNGYNDNGSGEAKLFILDIAKGVDGTWSAGDYIEISTGSGDAANRNGLASPALADIDGNGTIDRAYAGDLNGQMWAFDLSGSSSADWEIAGGQELFTTEGNQPITAQPTLSKHPTESDTGSNYPNLMVFFGSGQYLVNADKTTTNDNYFYGVWDNGADELDSSDLVEQTFDTSFSSRVLTNNSINYSGGDKGWYFELTDSGERSVTRPVVRGSIVFFNSFVPISDPCSVGGYGYRFAVDIISGGSPDDATIDVDNNNEVNESDQASNGTDTATVVAIQQEGFLPEPVFIEDIQYTAEIPSRVVKLKDIPRGRMSWQELLQ